MSFLVHLIGRLIIFDCSFVVSLLFDDIAWEGTLGRQDGGLYSLFLRSGLLFD